MGAVDPAPRGAETEEAEAVPAEVMVVAEGKAAVLAAPMAAAAEDGAGAAAEGIGAEGSRWAGPYSSFLLFVKSSRKNDKLIPSTFFQVKITFISQQF